ncbi:hypothetical protein ACFWSO_38720, partial [Streptomyces sp. NPDC058572]
MSVFADGAELEAAEAICSGGDIAQGHVFDLLTRLLDKSVLVKEDTGGHVRFRMLQGIREYGLECLRNSGEETALRRRYLTWYLDLVDQAEAEWFGPHQQRWSIRLSREETNLRSAVDLCAQEPTLAQAGLRIAASAWHIRLGSGPLDAWRQQLSKVLTEGTIEPSLERARALQIDGWAALLEGDNQTALQRLQYCQHMNQHLHDETFTTATLQFGGLVALFQGEFLSATDLLKQALTRQRERQDHGAESTTLLLLTVTYSLTDDPRAISAARRLVKLCQEHEAHISLSHALWSMGITHYRRGQPQRTITLIKR